MTDVTAFRATLRRVGNIRTTDHLVSAATEADARDYLRENLPGDVEIQALVPISMELDI